MVAIAISMTISMTIISTMTVSKTMISKTMSISLTVSTAIVTIVSIRLRLCLSLSLVQPGHMLEGASAGMELADSVCGTGVEIDGWNISVSIGSISTPFSYEVSTASIASGLDSISIGRRPGSSEAAVVR